MPVLFTSKLKPQATPEAPRTTTHAETSWIADTMLVSFGYADPLGFADADPAEIKQTGQIEARVFLQVAMSRTTYSRFMTGSLGLIATMADRDQLGWDEIVKIVNGK